MPQTHVIQCDRCLKIMHFKYEANGKFQAQEYKCPDSGHQRYAVVNLSWGGGIRNVKYSDTGNGMFLYIAGNIVNSLIYGDPKR